MTGEEYFPDGGVQRVALLQHGDDRSVEPGDLLARVIIEEAGEAPSHRAWHRDDETMIGELQREAAEQLPGASHLELWSGEKGRQGKVRRRRFPARRPARSEQDPPRRTSGSGPRTCRRWTRRSPWRPSEPGRSRRLAWPGSANGLPTQAHRAGTRTDELKTRF